MKTKVTIFTTAAMLLMTGAKATAQFRLGAQESFAASAYVDPSASLDAKSFNFGLDIEYRGAILAKAGVESFTALEGNYFDIHGVIAPRFTLGQQEDLSLHAGVRAGVVLRNSAANAILGVEAGLDHRFSSGFIVGVNSSYIYRGDMKAMGWPEIWRQNNSIKIGYTWNWKK